MQRSDVREADHRFRGSGRSALREPRQQPRGTVAAARAEHRADVRIGERGGELIETARIAPGEVAVALENPRSVLGAVARREHSEAGIESGALEAAGRRDHGHAVAGMQRRRRLEGCIHRAADSRRAGKGPSMSARALPERGGRREVLVRY